MNVQEFRNNFTYEEIDLIVKALKLLHGNVHQLALIGTLTYEEDKYIELLSSIDSLINEMVQVRCEF